MGEPTRGSKHAGLLPEPALPFCSPASGRETPRFFPLRTLREASFPSALHPLPPTWRHSEPWFSWKSAMRPPKRRPAEARRRLRGLPNRALRCARRGFSPCCPRRGLPVARWFSASLALAKLVGPVLSIPLLTLFATLPRATAARARRPGDGRSLPLRDSRPKRHGSDNLGSGPAAGGKLRLPCRMRGSHVNDPTAPAGKRRPLRARDRVRARGRVRAWGRIRAAP